jgi:NADH dehydrogenase (ubiquinone) 1 alpha/beta subcomplex 1, acyl-carrier protein
MYSAAAGLKQEEVEGRIMGILQGFDKVNDASKVRLPAHQKSELRFPSRRHLLRAIGRPAGTQQR